MIKLSRTYAALPFEYLTTLEMLTDAQFGRLMRWLLRYAAHGEMGELSGREKIFRETVRVNEDRFRENYEKQMAKRSEAGKKGAQARWEKSEQQRKEEAEHIRRNNEQLRRLLEMDGDL